jgi:hypothetical protein
MGTQEFHALADQIVAGNEEIRAATSRRGVGRSPSGR